MMTVRWSAASMLAAAVLLAGCGDGGVGPSGEDFGATEDFPGLGTFSAETTEVAEVCYTVTFDDFGSFTGFTDLAHADFVTQIPLPFGGPLTATLSDVGSRDDQLRIYSGDHVGGPDPDLEGANACPACGALDNMLVIGAYNWDAEGDSPYGGIVTLAGFPTVGMTTIESYVTADQDEVETGIELWVDGTQIGFPVVLGDGQVGTVTPIATPNLGTATSVEFLWNGSGALDNLQICHTPPPPPPTDPGTGTIGYWKNHPDAWPVEEIMIGGITYSKDAAIAIMKTAGKGDKTYNMFSQLVAAKLNVEIGNTSSCIDSTIADADAWMATYPVGSGVRAKDAAWKDPGGGLMTMLDEYNNGLLCAPHRD